MDQKENDELLHRLDERMERIENVHLRRLNTAKKRSHKNREAIDNLDDRVQKNETKISIMTGGIAGLIGIVVSKISAVFTALKHLI